HAHAVKSGVLFEVVIANHLINLYSKNGFAEEAQKVFDEMPQRNAVSWNTALNASIRCRDLSKAKAIFDSCPCKDSITYNSLLSGYARTDGYEAEATALFTKMVRNADIDEFTLTTMLNFAAKLRILSSGRQVHCSMVKTGNDSTAFAFSSLIDMYSKTGCFRDAYRVVDDGVMIISLVDLVVKNALLAACCREGEFEIGRDIFFRNPELRDDVSWNTMISGYAQNGHEIEAIELFKQMRKDGFHWSEHSFGGLLTACSALKCLNMGKEIHAWVSKRGMLSNPFINSGIVDTYSRCGNMKYAERAHEAYGGGGSSNVFATTSLIVGYSARGEMCSARRLFDLSTEKNFVIWTAVISGYVNLLQCDEALILFREYAANPTASPDVVILVSVLAACAIRASVDLGKQTHGFLLRSGAAEDEKVTSALIDMYSKCGFLSYADGIFRRAVTKDAVIYNVMISAYAHHGYGHRAVVGLFDEMRGRGIPPDAVTFIALLSACRHSGKIEAGENFFRSMAEDYGIPPEIDHYACMVDLYGRSNQLEKAVSFMETMPFDPDSIILSAFLNGCRASGNAELAKTAEERLLLENDGGRYFQLASVYAAGGRWEEMGRVMRAMRVGGGGKKEAAAARKLIGCSWVQVGCRVHVF
ncbi:hypothetical protein M569_10061, partial [Genlisea aurea]